MSNSSNGHASEVFPVTNTNNGSNSSPTIATTAKDYDRSSFFEAAAYEHAEDRDDDDDHDQYHMHDFYDTTAGVDEAVVSMSHEDSNISTSFGTTTTVESAQSRSTPQSFRHSSSGSSNAHSHHRYRHHYRCSRMMKDSDDEMDHEEEEEEGIDDHEVDIGLSDDEGFRSARDSLQFQPDETI
jgi:hypothetical protein